MNWVEKLFRFGRTSNLTPTNMCITCNVYREQLEYEREVNKEMTETLSSLLRPTPIILSADKPQLAPQNKAGTWARRRAELERADREAARLRDTSPVIAKSDDEIKAEEEKDSKIITINPNIIPLSSIEELEKDLLIEEEIAKETEETK